MPYGSEDYWLTRSRFMKAILVALMATLDEGGSVITALDGIDGSIDNVITLEQLNSEQCQMLAKMLGIETSVTGEGDLIAAIDILDGTMDGKLDLSQLNESLVATELTASIVQLTTIATEQTAATIDLGLILADLGASLTKLDAQIISLGNVDTNTGTNLHKNDIRVTTTPSVIYDISATEFFTYAIEGWASVDNTANVTFNMKRDAVQKYTFTLGAGGYKFLVVVADANNWNKVEVVAASGVQHLRYFAPFKGY